PAPLLQGEEVTESRGLGGEEEAYRRRAANQGREESGPDQDTRARYGRPALDGGPDDSRAQREGVRPARGQARDGWALPGGVRNHEQEGRARNARHRRFSFQPLRPTEVIVRTNLLRPSRLGGRNIRRNRVQVHQQEGGGLDEEGGGIHGGACFWQVLTIS